MVFHEGTLPVNEGEVELTMSLTGLPGVTVVQPYRIQACPSWGTTVHVDPAEKTATQVTIRFGTPVPPGGGFVDGAVVDSA